MDDSYVLLNKCDICHTSKLEWCPYGSTISYCTKCWLEYLNKLTRCSSCRKKFKMGDLCYDGWNRYTYRCKSCQEEYFSETSNKLYKEDVITMFDEVVH